MNINEVRNDFYDDIIGAYCIDVWNTSKNIEEGKCVAHVYDDGSVIYKYSEYRNNLRVLNAISEVLTRLNKSL